MLGIVSYGAYIPYHRLQKCTVNKEYDKASKNSEKAVAYYDEDSLTMAVAAAKNAADAIDTAKITAVSFASTTAPYAEKQCATQIAAALDLGYNVRTCDYAGSLRACASAMINAIETTKPNQFSLVAAGDCRLGGADGKNETDLGDAAASFVFGNEDVIAEVLDVYSVAMDYYDTWRSRNEKVIRDWDVRYSNTMHYQPLVMKAANGIMEQTGLKASDFKKVVCYAHEERHAMALASKLGFSADQVQPSHYSEIGNTGCAAAPIMLADALDSAESGDKILYLSYSDGCEAIVFQVTDNIEKYNSAQTVASLISHKNNNLAYGKYLKWKDFLLCEPQKRPPQERTSLPDYFRNYRKNHTMEGSICTECGTPHYPPQRVCANCKAVDKMQPYSFMNKKAYVRTFTVDGLSISLDPPNNLVVVEFEGGGKLMTYLVDCSKNDIYVGMPVKLSFRRMFEANGMNTYFWKAVPDWTGEEK